MAVDLNNLEVGDYVAFKAMGFAKVTEIEMDEFDDEHPFILTFEGFDTHEDRFREDGRYYGSDDPFMLDIIDIIPAAVIQRKYEEVNGTTSE